MAPSEYTESKPKFRLLT